MVKFTKDQDEQCHKCVKLYELHVNQEESNDQDLKLLSPASLTKLVWVYEDSSIRA